MNRSTFRAMPRMRTIAPIAAAAAALLTLSSLSLASSHREAPFITTSPKVDGTDFYIFRSYESGPMVRKKPTFR